VRTLEVLVLAGPEAQLSQRLDALGLVLGTPRVDDEDAGDPLSRSA
jgi:hypothetical protein